MPTNTTTATSGTATTTRSQNTFSTHELLEVHELLSTETTGAQKIQATIGTVQDAQLKNFMQTCFNSKQQRISQLQQLLSGTQLQ